jgi:hypothetical protein
MRVARITDLVYMMQRLPDAGIASTVDQLPDQSSALDVHQMQQEAREAELQGQIRALQDVLGAVNASWSWRITKPLRSIDARYDWLKRRLEQLRFAGH